MFIVDLTYKVELELVDKYVAQHRDWLDRAYFANKFLCSGVKNPRNGGIIIALTDNLFELKELLAQDPFCTHAIAEYTITEFVPSKCHTGFTQFM